MHRQVNIR